MKLNKQLLAFDSIPISLWYAISQLREQVFVVEQSCAYLDADGRDQLAHHLIWQDDGGILAYCRILNPGLTKISESPYVSIGRVVVDSRFRGIGLGEELMKSAIEHCRTLYGHNPIYISAQLHLQGFYEKLGFKAVGESYLEDGIPHISMLL
ncbi:GNAT family N-acetyltransferase [Membranihabitans marinus]|uniref:GNAT family N-acetyltransferase n=1 Tax=Membranihabitans marinus TaxID=1227546 RepID=UPI001F0326BB|nr:GNAT family N-acetyltransferase [Membranihabitans marinus]